ncbi:M64 family metallopeptidase [Zobellia galactanivorans]|uniref:CBM35-containing protein n=1 Tax=Zobellia galactanivorans (strain DSM 12802 / CCUG 47099 / CIP 106680 / NCIMB 13871 / Dsij) TaxID=63186 RepID=G0L8K7_ZOBGA|nr:M64 family metallopeptidase [Zobellia galactanivorans]CAZ97642.1 CBM35-containing protein [Zobellia galactanivorans]
MMKGLFSTIIFIVGFVSLAYTQSSEDGKWNDEAIDKLIAESELIPIQITGDKDNRINIVIMNQWTAADEAPYNSPDMRGEFVKDIEESMVAALTYGDERAQTAYASYKEFFNVYGLWAPSVPEWKKGIDRETVDAIRDKLFLPWKNEHRGWVTFLVMPNRDKGGGGAARNLEERVGTAVIAGNGIGKMLHEISHTCMSLGDEYTTAATGTGAFPTYAADLNYEREKIKWRKWIDPETPLPTPYEEEYIDKVGAFEGNQYHLVDYYRSTAQGCIMGAGVFDNTEEMCPVCNQRVSMRVYDLVDPVNGFSPSETSIEIEGVQKMHFSVDHIVPEPNTQVARWFLNGKLIAEGVDGIDVELGKIARYELVCSISDETEYIRPDPPFSRFPKFEVRWEISSKSAPTKASPLVVKLSKTPVSGEKTVWNITSDISGGVPPYSYQWSDGTTGPTLKDSGLGIYELTVTDSEYRTATSGIDIYAGGLASKTKKSKSKKRKKKNEISVGCNIKASDIGKANGMLAISPSGGKAPYTVLWKKGKYQYGSPWVYESENATITDAEYTVKHLFSASNNTYVDLKGNEGSVSWEVKVANSGIYPVDIIYAGIFMKGSSAKLMVNGVEEKESVHFNQTRPLYTGWDVATAKVFLKEGINTVKLFSNGESLPNLDYLRVPTRVEAISVSGNERIGLAPGTYEYVVMDSESNTVEGVVVLPETYPFKISDISVENTSEGTVGIASPVNGYTYKWYAKDAPQVKLEHYEKPLGVGNTFRVPHKGTFYVAAYNEATNAESSNRIGFAVGDIADRREVRITPEELGEDAIKLWFDSSDIDGNGKPDEENPDRGPVKSWEDKSIRNGYELFMKYEPNALNGKGVAAFDHVWVSIMKEEVKEYQTIVLVYKEGSVSFPGTSLFRGLNAFIGRSSDVKKSLFDLDAVDDRTKKGQVFLNGKKVDPFTTPNPMEFCILTVELASPSDVPLARTEGLWEGAIAEMILIDRKLLDWERKGLEEYLRRKWFAMVDIKFE